MTPTTLILRCNRQKPGINLLHFIGTHNFELVRQGRTEAFSRRGCIATQNILRSELKVHACLSLDPGKIAVTISVIKVTLLPGPTAHRHCTRCELFKNTVSPLKSRFRGSDFM